MEILIQFGRRKLEKRVGRQKKTKDIYGNYKTLKKRHKYNLTGIAPPAGYRFLRNEKIQPGDGWWISYYENQEDYIELNITAGGNVSEAFPMFLRHEKLWVGYVRKLDS